MRNPPARIVAFLQNQWFRDPARMEVIFNRHPELREDLIARYLFAGCLTGKRLRAAFGDLCDEIIWEETSRKVGGESSSVFPPDLIHMKGVLVKWEPKLIICFGRVAQVAIGDLAEDVTIRAKILFGPHPAARFPEVCATLRCIAQEITPHPDASPQSSKAG